MEVKDEWMKVVGEKFVQQSSDFLPLLEFLKGSVLCVFVCVCGSTSRLPPCQGSPLSFPLCALALEVTSFGVQQADTQQEQLSL